MLFCYHFLHIIYGLVKFIKVAIYDYKYPFRLLQLYIDWTDTFLAGYSNKEIKGEMWMHVSRIGKGWGLS